jgi:uncharacterized membrane protein YidH (DUF202 family)
MRFWLARLIAVAVLLVFALFAANSSEGGWQPMTPVIFALGGAVVACITAILISAGIQKWTSATESQRSWPTLSPNVIIGIVIALGVIVALVFLGFIAWGENPPIDAFTAIVTAIAAILAGTRSKP